jgi:hypothetical protein
MNPNSEDENTGRCILQANSCAAQIVERRETLRVIAADPDESHVHECALEGRAEVIVSGSLLRSIIFGAATAPEPFRCCDRPHGGYS